MAVITHPCYNFKGDTEMSGIFQRKRVHAWNGFEGNRDDRQAELYSSIFIISRVE